MTGFLFEVKFPFFYCAHERAHKETILSLNVVLLISVDWDWLMTLRDGFFAHIISAVGSFVLVIIFIERLVDHDH